MHRGEEQALPQGRAQCLIHLLTLKHHFPREHSQGEMHPVCVHAAKDAAVKERCISPVVSTEGTGQAHPGPFTRLLPAAQPAAAG